MGFEASFWEREAQRLNEEFEAAAETAIDLLSDQAAFDSLEATRTTLAELDRCNPELARKLDELSGKIVQLAIDGFI